MSKVALVLEGGAMRGMFTAGVLDVLLDSDVEVDGIIGVSAGALFGVNYFSKQKGRVIRYSKRFCKDLRYMSFLSLLITGNVVNKNFAYYKMPRKLDVFDAEEFGKTNKDYYVVITNVETGEAEYKKIINCNEEIEYFRASSALPMASKLIEIDGKKYLDGGISDAIPVKKCQSLGYDKIIVVLTQPENYRKEQLDEKTIKRLEKRFKKYPKLVEIMKNRYKNYNDTVEEIRKMEEKGEVFVIRPTQRIKVSILERNPDKLQEIYELGIKNAKEQLDELLSYIKRS